MIMSNWSIAGITTGAIFSIGSFIRYWILYPDMDKAIAYIFLGGIICGISWIYNKLVYMQRDLTAIEDYLDDKRESEK
jgi:hypothetical protein